MAEQEPIMAGQLRELDAIQTRYERDLKAGIDLILARADLELSALIDSPNTVANKSRGGGSYENIRWSDRGKLSPELALDIAEARAGQPLSRHQWLQDVLDDITPERRKVGGGDIVRAMLSRMQGLASQPERDIELERATVEMGFRYTSSPDCDGNPFSFVHVRAPEMYTRGYKSDKGGSRWSRDWAGTDREIIRANAVGVGHIYALYQMGADMGYTGENAGRWFITYRAEGVNLDVPFDAITEVVDCCDHGSMVEYETAA